MKNASIVKVITVTIDAPDVSSSGGLIMVNVVYVPIQTVATVNGTTWNALNVRITMVSMAIEVVEDVQILIVSNAQLISHLVNFVLLGME